MGELKGKKLTERKKKDIHWKWKEDKYNCENRKGPSKNPRPNGKGRKGTGVRK